MKQKFKNGQRVFHPLFGWCVIDLLGINNVLINCEADVIEYYVMGKGYVKYERDENGKQIVSTHISEIFETEENIPPIFGLKKLAMNIKLTKHN